MAIALGIFDPKIPPREAAEMLFRAYPELKARVKKAEEEFAKNSLFVHFIAHDSYPS